MKRGMLPILLLILLLCLSACADSEQSMISRETGVDVSAGRIERSEDNHGGFHGDGETLVILKFSAEEGAALERQMLDAGWKSLPLSGRLSGFIYGENFGLLLSEDGAHTIPDISAGYYWFYDRHDESTDRQDDTQLMNRYSMNFSLALYDSEQSRLYFYVLDT